MSSGKSEKSDPAPKTATDRLIYALGYDLRTQKEIAEEAGISEGHLSEAKSGKVPVRRNLALGLERARVCQAEWLLTGVGPFVVKETGQVYEVTGPLSSPRPPRQSARVDERTAYHCGYCHGEVAPGHLSCPHCGALLQWVGEMPEGEQDLGDGI